MVGPCGTPHLRVGILRQNISWETFSPKNEISLLPFAPTAGILVPVSGIAFTLVLVWWVCHTCIDFGVDLGLESSEFPSKS